MKPMRMISWLAVAATVVVTGLVVAAAPASAEPAGFTRYENVGNPTWCLHGDSTDVYLRRCQSADQLWFYTAPATRLKLRLGGPAGQCITAGEDGVSTSLKPCDVRPWDTYQYFDALGQNGWVYFVSALTTSTTFGCLRPINTHLPRTTYDIGLGRCPDSPANVPNIVAWRYFRLPGDPVV